MLLDGMNHVAIITSDTDRLHAFYRDVFDATVSHDMTEHPVSGSPIVDVGPHTELNVFEIDGNNEAARQTRCSGAGASTTSALQPRPIAAFDTIRERLIERGATDGFVTDFGPILSLFFRDPDGLEAEVCVANPDAKPGELNPPGTPAPGYDVVG